ncbi:F-box/kelch-repeat protein-like protein [Tanacetum coccineum]
MYDMADDMWTPLPDMADEHDECKGVFHRGKFYVVSGYDMAKQEQFKKSTEAFDLFTWQWGLREDDFSRDDIMRIPNDLDSVPCIIGWDGRLLAVGCVGSDERHGVYMLDLESSIWTKVEVPEEYSGRVQSGCCLEYECRQTMKMLKTEVLKMTIASNRYSVILTNNECN